MENFKIRLRLKAFLVVIGWLSASFCLNAEEVDSISSDIIHRIEVETNPSFIIHTSRFLRGENLNSKSMDYSNSVNFKYSFRFSPNTLTGKIYGSSYQGIGVSKFWFGNKKELGNPTAVYLFQGARLATLMHNLTFNYEWNFGVSMGWHPYNYDFNSLNRIIGSKVNAYLNTNFYLSWRIFPKIDMNIGTSLAHFSNGNTKYPNAGLNTIGFKVGLVYNINESNIKDKYAISSITVPNFRPFIDYDIVMFGSWRRKGVMVGDTKIAAPKAYPVLGFNLSPMYNISYKCRMGVSMDGFYDGSTDITGKLTRETEEVKLYQPSFWKQLSLGLSARAEYVMPYFTVGIGVGYNILNSGHDSKGAYQILALKIDVTKNSFLHIGYSLKDFETPNFLMLGIGMRFNSKYPYFHGKRIR